MVVNYVIFIFPTLSSLTPLHYFFLIYSLVWSDYFVVVNWILFSNMSFEIKREQRIAYKVLLVAKEQQVMYSMRCLITIIYLLVEVYF